MRKPRSSFTLAAFIGTASVIAAASCTLDTEGLADPWPSTDGSLGGSGGSLPDVVQPKDQSAEAEAAKPDVVKPDVQEAGDVVTEQQECFPGMKVCEGDCVSNSLPEWGCDPKVCTPCNLPHAVEMCSADHCAVASCDLINPNDNPDANPKAPRWGDCNAPKWDDGCETRLDTTLNCGECGVTCSPINANGDCTSGECALGTCKPGYADCDTKLENGCEVDVNNDVNNCGKCAYVCPLSPGATKMTCLDGKCEPDMCEAGKKDCDGNPGNGCETDITQLANCGGCGNDCTDDYKNGVAECKPMGLNYGCAFKECVAPFADCNGTLGDGCEVDTLGNITHCGACNATCSTLNGANPQCKAGKCALTCNADFTNCEDPAHPEADTARNGCETNIKGDTGDPDNCGGCGWKCETANASKRTCTKGTCGYTCNYPWESCGPPLPGDVDLGCSVNKLSDPQHCGSCTTACSSAGGEAVCVNSACNTICDADHANCDGNVTNGCEADLNSTTSCGACNKKCQGSNATWACANKQCSVTQCSSTTWGNCDNDSSNGCETPLTSLTNCGGCGTSCGSDHATAQCVSGTCSIICQSSYGNCDGDPSNGCEILVSSDPLHCGVGCVKCTTPANASPLCAGGTCTFGCLANFGDCDGQAGTGCEADFTKNTSHCGGCNKPCTVSNGTPACNNSVCGVGGCTSGWGDCDGLYPNGCEANFKASTTHCGGCNKPCTIQNGTGGCTNGVCTVSACDESFGNCDKDASNGCETPTLTSLAHCGGCNQPCEGKNAVWQCGAGTCLVNGCIDMHADCNFLPADGCEVDLKEDETNCGACKTQCELGKTCVNGTCQ